MKVLKRDKTVEDFKLSKIEKAIKSAFDSCGVTPNDDILDCIKKIYDESKDETIGVEDIQDNVERCLMASYPDVAKAYIIYRYQHKLIRENQSKLTKQIKKKLTAEDVQNQNANVDEFSFGGRVGEASRVVTKQYALDYCMSRKARNNHMNNEIYIHDLDSYAIGMHNCCKKSTKFITDKGVFSFENFKDGEIVKVLTHQGNWKNAVVHQYGNQKIYKITFKRSGNRLISEYFTKDHRWILSDGSITTNLKVGDKIYKAPTINRIFDFDNASESEKKFWCLGFVIGDGTEAFRWNHKKQKTDIKFIRLRLCGGKVKFSERFNCLKHSKYKMENGDLMLTFSSIIDFRKELPDVNTLTLAEKKALFDGLYCADGQKSGNIKTLQTSNKEVASFIEKIAPTIGYYITFEKDLTGYTTNYGKRKFTKNYFFTGEKNKYYWIVESIEEYGYEDVWCLDVEDDHSFVLPNGLVTGNCLTIPFDELLSKGFKTRQTDIRPANSINTAFQLIAVLFQIQSLQQFGGVAAGHIDWTIVPYVRKSFYKHFTKKYALSEMKKEGKYITDSKELSEYRKAKRKEFNEKYDIKDEKFTIGDFSMDCVNFHIGDEKIININKDWYEEAYIETMEELMQAIEGMYHNLNSLQSRSGNQLPFTSINYGTCTLPEGRMVIKALLEGSMKGVGEHHLTPIFPCGIFQCMKGVNRKEGEPNYDLFKIALKSTSQRIYPNYCNVDWSNNKGYDVNNPRTYNATMGCRTYNGYDINGFGQLKDGRGNLAPVTIIMPTLAMEVKQSFGEKEYTKEEFVTKFLKLLDKKIFESKDMLLERFERMCKQSPKAATFMWENGSMFGYNEKEGPISALRHGTLVIGQLGLAETLQILIGTDHTTEEGMTLAKEIEGLFKKRCSEFKDETHLNFGVYYTPAENLCYTSFKKFKEQYGDIEGVTYFLKKDDKGNEVRKDKEYFTNSIHVPVYKEMSPFEKIDIESQLTCFSNAGCITYVELPSGTNNNIEGLETIVNYAMDKDIPYFAINVPIDECHDCGFTGEIGEVCTECGSRNIEHLRRVTGYLSTTYEHFNLGKQDETKDRVKHINKI